MFIDNIEKDLTEKVSAQVRLNQSRGGMCIYVHRGLGLGFSQKSFGP